MWVSIRAMFKDLVNQVPERLVLNRNQHRNRQPDRKIPVGAPKTLGVIVTKAVDPMAVARMITVLPTVSIIVSTTVSTTVQTTVSTMGSTMVSTMVSATVPTMLSTMVSTTVSTMVSTIIVAPTAAHQTRGGVITQ